MTIQNDSGGDGDERTVQMIGTLPPWKGISAYCSKLYEGLTQECEQFKFTGWKSLYPKFLYPGGDPKTGEEPLEGDNIERILSWYNPLSWISVGLDPDVDLIHAQWWSYPLAVPYVVLFKIGKSRRKTVLLTVHNVAPHEQTPLTTFLNNAVYRFADKYVVHSEENKTKLCEVSSIDRDDVHVISHPIIGPEKRGVSKSESLRKLGLDQNTNVVLFFGNVREYKGLDSLIRMIENINQSQEVHLVVAGKCWVDWDEYESLIEECGLSDKVHRYSGYIPEDQVEFFFTAADAVALPYEYFDAQSGVASLAHHFGTISVGYDRGGLAEQLDVVAADQGEFEKSLLGAIDGTVQKRPVTDESVKKHVELYKELLSDAVN